MRKLLSVLCLLAIGTVIATAQEPGGRGRGRGPQEPPKNLKVLPAENLIPTMRAAAAGLGVMCGFCHETDRSSDAKPEKLTARKMFEMVKDINSRFPDGKEHVTCYTCHRGAEMPLTAPPAAQ